MVSTPKPRSHRWTIALVAGLCSASALIAAAAVVAVFWVSGLAFDDHRLLGRWRLENEGFAEAPVTQPYLIVFRPPRRREREDTPWMYIDDPDGASQLACAYTTYRRHRIAFAECLSDAVLYFSNSDAERQRRLWIGAHTHELTRAKAYRFLQDGRLAIGDMIFRREGDASR